MRKVIRIKADGDKRLIEKRETDRGTEESKKNGTGRKMKEERPTQIKGLKGVCHTVKICSNQDHVTFVDTGGRRWGVVKTGAF